MYTATVIHSDGSKTTHEHVRNARIGNIRRGKPYVKLLLADDSIKTIKTGFDVELEQAKG